MRHVSSVIDCIVAKWPQERQDAFYAEIRKRQAEQEGKPCGAEFATSQEPKR